MNLPRKKNSGISHLIPLVSGGRVKEGREIAKVDWTVVYTKTSKGMHQVMNRTDRLPRDLNRVLMLVDGSSDIHQLLERSDGMSESRLENAIQSLIQEGYIRVLTRGGLTENEDDLAFPASIIVSELDTQAFFDAEAQSGQNIPEKQSEFPGKNDEVVSPQKTGEAAPLKAAKSAAVKPSGNIHQFNGGSQGVTAISPVDETSPGDDVIDARRKRRLEARAREEEAAQTQAAAKARAKAEAEAQSRKVAEAIERAEREEMARHAVELRAKAEAEARAKAEREHRQRLEVERRQREAEEKARQKDEAEAKARAELEVKRRIEAEIRVKAEIEARDRIEAEYKTKLEAERKAREEALAKVEEEIRKRQEQELKAQAEADSRARLEAEAAERQKAEEMARKEAEALAKAKLRQQARREEELEAKLKAEAEAKTRLENELSARLEEEMRARAEAEAKALAEVKRRETEEKARREAEEKAQAEAQRREAEERARRDAEDRIRAEEEAAKAWAEHEARLKSEAEALVRAEAEARARAEAAELARLEAEQHARDEMAAREREESRRKEEEAARLRAEAEARKIAEAEAAIRREAEEVKARMEARQRAEEEAKANAVAMAEAAERAAEEQARREAEARAKVVAETKTRQEEAEKARSRKEKWRYQRTHWAKPALGGVAGLLVLALVILFLIPLDGYVPKVETALSKRIGEPVHIGKMTLAAWPLPHLEMTGVMVGKLHDFKLGKVDLYPVWRSLPSGNLRVARLEVITINLDKSALVRVERWSHGTVDSLPIKEVRFSDASIVLANGSLSGVKGSILYTDKGDMQSASFRTEGDGLVLLVTPTEQAAKFQLGANHWASPFGLPLKFDHLAAKGEVGPSSINIAEFDGTLYGGAVSGNGTVAWDDKIDARIKLNIKDADLQSLLPLFTKNIIVDGAMDLKGELTAHSDTVEGLLAFPAFNGSFAIKEGVLGNVDLMNAVQARDKNIFTGGRTTFTRLEGALNGKSGRLQFSHVKLVSGVLSANGAVDIDASGKLSGHTQVEVRSRTTVVNASLAVTGGVGEPLLKRTAVSMRREQEKQTQQPN